MSGSFTVPGDLCLLLCLTGLGMMFHTFNFVSYLFGGLHNMKFVHNFTGIVFSLPCFWRSACGGRRRVFLSSLKI